MLGYGGNPLGDSHGGHGHLYFFQMLLPAAWLLNFAAYRTALVV